MVPTPPRPVIGRSRRHEVLLRRDGAEAEALLPSSTYRPVEIGGELQWWRTSSLPEMALTVTPRG